MTCTSSSVRSVTLTRATNHEHTCRVTVMRLAAPPQAAPELANVMSPEFPTYVRSCSYWPCVTNGPWSSPSPWQFSTSPYDDAVQSLRCRALVVWQSTTCP
ncbi:Uncharacterised protein [Mycobacteroides abscessus]|nr:Uncharacterised protein [Mycobacteroides abscessus]